MKKMLLTAGVFVAVIVSIMILDPTLTPSWLRDLVGAEEHITIDSQLPLSSENSGASATNSKSEDQSSALQSESSLGILTQGVPPRVGERAPDFALRDLDGKIVRLSEFIGEKLVVLNFWATWCSPCVVEMPDLEEIYQKHMDDIVILGIDNQESLQVVNKFLDEEVNVTYPILLDSDGQVTLGYNIFAQPTTFFVDRTGFITPINQFPGKFGAFTPGELIDRINELLHHDETQQSE